MRVVLAPLLFATALIPGTLAAQAKSEPDSGVFTAAQADAGRRIYTTYCVACHGVELEGSTGPALAGQEFHARWNGQDEQTLTALFEVLRTTMPRPAMGSLSAQAYLDVMAYLLQRNGAPAGGRPLTVAALATTTLPEAAGSPKKVAPAFIAGERGLAPSGNGPSRADLRAAADPADWLYATRDLGGTRHSPLAQITRENAGRMAVACIYQVGSTETFHTNPVVHDGVMYLTTPRITVAIDAATCRQRWRHAWEPQDRMLWQMNRGVAIQDGYVVRGTADGYLLALDAADGHLLWARQVARPSEGETITMPPMIVEDLVLIGPAGSENAIQGWVGAFRLHDGSPVWRFNTIPRPGEPGAETWQNADSIPVGGGALWTPLSLDAPRGELYVAVTNPAPDLPAHLRPGKNLYTNAIIALDVRTGALRWYDQMVPSDARDYDLTQVSPVLRTTVGGRVRDLVTTVGKDGVLRMVDRVTHERLYATEVTTRSNAEGPLPPEGLHVCPGVLGGVEWNGPAYDPASNLLFVPAVDWCARFTPDTAVTFVPGRLYMGGKVELDPTRQGWLTAVDASTGAVRWRYRSNEPMVAGVTTTGGGLVVTGEMTGDFLVFDAADGRELYRFYTGSGVLGGVVTYAVEGRQYIATTSGGGSFNFGTGGSPTIVVFALPRSNAEAGR